jgi:hypothetical protein
LGCCVGGVYYYVVCGVGGCWFACAFVCVGCVVFWVCCYWVVADWAWLMSEVCEFSYKAGYDQAVIDDTKKVELALEIVSYLVKENERLTKLVRQQGKRLADD